MNDLSDQQLVRDYANSRSESAFSELVARHVNMVYSAALRMTRDDHSARDATQGAFVALAQNAQDLTQHPVISGWLHCTARNLAVKSIRADARRRVREQEAVVMNQILSSDEAPWENIAPHLDAALNELNEAERDAVMLRYFEKKSASEIAQVLGISAEAAQKRISRAIDRLRDIFAKHGVTASTGCLALAISTNAVQAAPTGLAISIASAAMTGTAVPTSTAIAVTKTITMTTLQKTLITATIIALAGAGIYESRQNSQLRDQLSSLNQDSATRQAALSNQVQQLEKDRDTARKALASATAEKHKNPSEVLKLRGEVGQLRQAKANISSKSPLSKVTANPEARKLFREQQKTGFGSLYRNLAADLKLPNEKVEKLNDLLADHAMQSVENITLVLRDKPSSDAMNELFSSQEAQLEKQLESELGEGGLAKFQDYNRHILSSISADQFSESLTGTNEEIQRKKAELRQLIQEEAESALKEEGLQSDFQLVPMLNFRNFVSEQDADKNLKLLDSVYGKVAARATSFLSEKELAHFKTFREAAFTNNRASLSLNRAMMAPIAE